MAIFTQNYKVYINHTDAGGIVYHANHLTFFEHCRRDWLSHIGFDSYFFENGTHFVVYKADLTYKKALTVDDRIIVSIETIDSKSASLVMRQHIYKNQDDFEKGTIATIGIITLAYVKKVDNTLKPCPIPAQMTYKPA